MRLRFVHFTAESTCTVWTARSGRQEEVGGARTEEPNIGKIFGREPLPAPPGVHYVNTMMADFVNNRTIAGIVIQNTDPSSQLHLHYRQRSLEENWKIKKKTKSST